MANKNLSEFSNGDKQSHGQHGKDSIETLLFECKEKYRYIRDYVREYRTGYKGYSLDQFYCNFLVIFGDDTKWVIKTTTSFRSDRIKGNLWDSLHLKRIDSLITKSLLVYSDSLDDKDKENFLTFKYRVINKDIYSSIDDVVSQRELFKMIEDYANLSLSIGKKKDKQGTVFEGHIATILNSKDNFEKWKTNDPTVDGLEYNTFEKIVSYFKIDRKKVLSIRATADAEDIGCLISSGSPKTDVIVYVSTREPDSLKTFTISCKKTSCKLISVHQYSANDFTDVLDSSNSRLRELLNDFQKVGGINSFGFEKSIELKEELSPHIEKLIRWVIGGYGGKIQNKLQLANYILINDEVSNEIYIHSLEEYTKVLLLPENEKQFGTPFQWTFASGQKGKSIQLKCVIIK